MHILSCTTHAIIHIWYYAHTLLRTILLYTHFTTLTHTFPITHMTLYTHVTIEYLFNYGNTSGIFSHVLKPFVENCHEFFR